MREKIFIIGYYGWNNTGDDAMLYSLLQNLNEYYDDVEFSILSRSSLITPPLKNEARIISSDRPVMAFWEIINSSIFILGGGTHLYDYGKKKNRILRLSQMLVLVTIAKIFRKKIYLLGIGVESPTTTWGKHLIKNICKLADKITLRDSFSYSVLNEMGLKDNIIRSFDLAALLPYPSSYNKTNVLNEKRVLGISILPFYEIYYNNKEKDELLISNLAKDLDEWLRNEPEGMIYLFIFKGESKDDDARITNMLQKQLEQSKRVKLIDYDPHPVEMLHKIAQCSAFIGMRYHSCLFAYLAGIPMIIIDYAEKNRSLAYDIGLNGNAIISLDSVLNGKFSTFLTNLQTDPNQFRATLPRGKAAYIAKNAFREALN